MVDFSVLYLPDFKGKPWQGESQKRKEKNETRKEETITGGLDIRIRNYIIGRSFTIKTGIFICWIWTMCKHYLTICILVTFISIWKLWIYVCHVISTGSKTLITTVEKIDFTFRNGKDIDFDLARTSSKPSLWWEGSTVQLVGRELKQKNFCWNLWMIYFSTSQSKISPLAFTVSVKLLNLTSTGNNLTLCKLKMKYWQS